MALNVAINGFGRIGRTFLRTVLQDEPASKNINVVAINQGPKKAANLDVLFQYDSVMRAFPGTVTVDEHTLTINGKKIMLLAEVDPAKLPWKQLDIDWVIEASGCFTTKEKAQKHISAGSKNVLITAPSTDADATIILGVNQNQYDPKNHTIISLGSCTTTCFTPVVKVLHETFSLTHGFMTTVHAYTNDQVLLDVQHQDPRRARAAAINIIPTKTGVSSLIGKIFPDLDGKIIASALRVPVPNASLLEFTFTCSKQLSVDAINTAFQTYANGAMNGVLEYETKPLVSSDFIGNPASCIFDSLLTQHNSGMGKVSAWYDNEFGYSCRIKDFLALHKR